MMKRVFGKFKILVVFVGLFFLVGCGGGGDTQKSFTPSVTLANTQNIVTITANNKEILTSKVDETNMSIKKIVLSKDTSTKIENNKEILFIPSGVDDRFPLGYAGQIIKKTKQADGSTEVQLVNASLEQVVDEAKAPEKTYDLSEMKLVGAIIPDIVSAGSNKTSKVSRNAQIFAGGAVIHEPRSSFLGAGEVFTQGKIKLNYKIDLNKIVDSSEYATAITNLSLNIRGSLDNLKITESHDIDFSYDLKNIVDVDVQQKFICEGDFDAEISLKGKGSFKIGYVNSVWKDVEKQAFEKFGISVDFIGLKSVDKVGKIPLTGLVFNTGVHTTGNLNKDVKTAQVGGIVVWIYYNMSGEITVDGSVGMGVYPHFKFGIDKVKGGDANLISELTPQKHKRIIEAPFIDGSVSYKLTKGLSVEADAFVSGVRIINAGMDIKMDLQKRYKTQKRVSYGVTNIGDDWSWSDGIICQEGSIGAGAIFHADIAAGVVYEKNKGNTKLSWEVHPQYPSKNALNSKKNGWVGTWYNFTSQRECSSIPSPSTSINQHISNHRVPINIDTLKQISDENYLYAYLSNRIYAAKNSDIDKSKDGWVLINLTNNKLNGFKAGLYQRENNNQYIVVYAGTTGTTSTSILGKTYDGVIDILADIALFSNNYFKPDQAKDAISFFNESQKKVGSGKIVNITGHSLGGGLAQYVGLYSGIETITFNTAPLPYTTDTYNEFFPTGLVQIAGKNSDGELTRIAFKHKDKIKNIMLPYDPISTISTALMALDEDNSPFALSSKWLLFVKDELKLDFLITGEQIYLPTQNQGGLFNFSNHSIDLVEEILQKNTTYALSFTTKFDGTKLIIESPQTTNDIKSYKWKIYQNGTLIKSGDGIDNISGLTAGNYEIELYALLPNAMWVKNKQSITIETQGNTPPSIITFKYNQSLPNQEGNFTIQARDNTAISSITIEYGDGASDNESYLAGGFGGGSDTTDKEINATFAHTYIAGNYTAKLTVCDEDGMCSDKSISIQVSDTPIQSTSKVLKTGQTTSYTNFDDGYYQKGIDRSYTRDDIKQIVTDNATGLMWQDDEEAKTVKKPWVTQANYDAGKYMDISGDTATTYCQNLMLGEFNDWRLPTRKELVLLSDYGKYSPAINSVFQNIFYDDNWINSEYWTATTNFLENYNAWSIHFSYGHSYHSGKSVKRYIRCVREKNKGVSL